MDVTPLTGSAVADQPVDQLPFYHGWLCSLPVMLELLRVMRRLHLTLNDTTRDKLSRLMSQAYDLDVLTVPPFSLVPFGQAGQVEIRLTVNPRHSDRSAPNGMIMGRQRVLHHLFNHPDALIDGELIHRVLEICYLELIATLRANGYDRALLASHFKPAHDDFVRAHEHDEETALIEAVRAIPTEALQALLDSRPIAGSAGFSLVYQCVQFGVPAFWDGWRIGMEQVSSAGSAWLANTYSMDAAQTKAVVASIRAQTNPIMLTVADTDCIQPIESLVTPEFWHLAAGVMIGRQQGIELLEDERRTNGYSPAVNVYRRTMTAWITRGYQEVQRRLVASGGMNPHNHQDTAPLAALLANQVGGSL